jgi:PTH1 family peptidyl-tRNA hydrolase
VALFGRTAKRGTPYDFLIVGLGNPGKEYARTRHNVGEEVVGVLAQRAGGTLKAGRDKAKVAEVKVRDRRCVLAFPLTYMNESGQAVGALARRYGITDPAQIIIVHDELDLPPGQLRVKVGGGLAGNNGLRSITQHLKTQDFVRVRIGIGKPPSKERGAKHVLSRLPKAEREALDVAVQLAADAVEVLVGEGADAAMRRFNGGSSGGNGGAKPPSESALSEQPPAKDRRPTDPPASRSSE